MRVVFYTDRQNTFNGKALHPRDLAYKKALQNGLKDSFGINCKC